MSVRFKISRKKGDQDVNPLMDDFEDRSAASSARVVPLATLIHLRWIDYQDAEAEAVAAFEESPYTPLLPAKLHWRRWCDLPEHQRTTLFKYELLPSISNLKDSSDPTALTLRRLYSSIETMSRFDPMQLTVLIDWLKKQPFETPGDRRLLLEYFDKFLNNNLSPESGEFRTPESINRLLAALAAPSPGDSIYDPCLGFAGTMTAAWKIASESSDNPKTTLRSAGPPVKIAGLDINPTAYTIGLLRLILAGAHLSQIELGNSLEREDFDNPKKDGYDLVICNPPFGLKASQAIAGRFPVPSRDGISLFIQHSLMQLRPGGRAVLVVNDGFLMQGDKTADVRKWLLQNHTVEAVIDMPSWAFRSITRIRASILIIRRDGGPTSKVRMIKGTSFFEKSLAERKTGEKRSEFSDSQISKILELLRGQTFQGSQSDSPAWDVQMGELDDFDYVLSAVHRESNRLPEVLKPIAEHVEILPLNKVCRIESGRSLSKECLREDPDGNKPMPLVRIRDIQHGRTMKPTSWVSDEARHDFKSHHILRAGDILVGKAGTIGKIGIVSNGCVGGVAGSTLYVLRPETSRLDPQYLAAFLQSKECQKWFSSYSSGSVISHLKRKFLQKLPIPVAPPKIQESIARDYTKNHEDAIERLLHYLIPSQTSTLERWIMKSISHLESSSYPRESDPLSFAKSKLFTLDLITAADDDDDSIDALEAWAREILELRRNLEGIENIPEGPGYYALIQTGLSMLRSASSKIQGRSVAEVLARDLTEQYVDLLEKASDSMLQAKALEIKVAQETLISGQRNEIEILVRNNGNLPFKSLSIRTKGYESKKHIYLPEKSEKTVTAEILAPSEGGTFTAQLLVDLVLLNGDTAHQAIEVPLKLSGSLADIMQKDIGYSPYFHSKPVGKEREDIFIGREEIIDRIKRQIISGNTLLLEGNRRAGKTSILMQLEGLEAIPGHIVIFSDFQGAEGDQTRAGIPTEEVWRSLAASIAEGLQSAGIFLPLPDGSELQNLEVDEIVDACAAGISIKNPWKGFLDYISLVMRHLAEKKYNLVLMIDEFDKLQEGIDNGVTSPQIPENIRHLIQHLSGFSAILTGSRRMERLRHEYWSALFALGTRIGVTALKQEAAERLIRKPVEGRLQYSDEAVKTLIELTARQPFLIQSLCNEVFESAVENSVRAITKQIVEDSADRFIEDSEHFNTLMDYAQTDRRKFLLMLIHSSSGEPEPMTFGVLQNRLLQEGLQFSDQALTRDLRLLQDLELVDFKNSDGGRYTLTIPLMGRWLDFHEDYQALHAKAKTEQEDNL